MPHLVAALFACGLVAAGTAYQTLVAGTPLLLALPAYTVFVGLCVGLGYLSRISSRRRRK